MARRRVRRRAKRGGLRRSRFLILGAFALAFGSAVLGFNLLNERHALGASGSFADLPTVESMMRRFGLRDHYKSGPWEHFLKVQFHRIGRMSMPYALSYAAEPGRPSWVMSGVLATGGALLGMLLARRRPLLAVLGLSGFCWALPMRNNTALPAHDFESLYWIGVPLVLFSCALLGIRRLLGGVPVAGLAVAAAAAFALSSQRMGGTGHDAAAAKREAYVMADFAIISRMTRGQRVFVKGDIERLAGAGRMAGRWALEYYLAGSLIQYDKELLTSRGPFDFGISNRRGEPGHLLTPGNRWMFLYEWFDVDASRLSEYRSLVAGEPMLRGRFDLYLRGRELSYLRAPCKEEETDPWFFLHVIPSALDDLPRGRREHGFDNLDFRFSHAGGRLFHGNCMVTVKIPRYDIARIRTGQWLKDEGAIWEVAGDLPARRP